jgi:hypothetical protein
MVESNDEWDDSIASFPDVLFESRLRAEENMRSHLWQLYTNGEAFVRSSVEILLDSIKFLYGESASGRVRALLARELTGETTLKKLGLCLQLHAENPWVPHSRIDLLGALNIDLQDIFEERDCDSTVLREFRDFQCAEPDNLPLVEIHVEVVHGILTRCHFTDLIRSHKTEPCDAVGNGNCNFGTKIWDVYTKWRIAAREHSSTFHMQPVDWETVRADLHQSDDWYALNLYV